MHWFIFSRQLTDSGNTSPQKGNVLKHTFHACQVGRWSCSVLSSPAAGGVWMIVQAPLPFSRWTKLDLAAPDLPKVTLQPSALISEWTLDVSACPCGHLTVERGLQMKNTNLQKPFIYTPLESWELPPSLAPIFPRLNIQWVFCVYIHGLWFDEVKS